MKKVILKLIAKAGLKTAELACGSASAYGFYQPKEPKELKSKKSK